jgi:hypothetical protein
VDFFDMLLKVALLDEKNSTEITIERFQMYVIHMFSQTFFVSK